MKRIFFSMLILAVISSSTVFAQTNPITVQTDDNNYDEGDTIVISGQITTVVPGTPVVLQIFFGGNMIDIAQIIVAQDGSYTHTVIAEGPLWNKTGDYLVRASFGEGNIAESEFSFSPKTEVKKTTDNFEVDAGDYGTFDVEYTIKGGTVEGMVVDSKNLALIVEIDSIDDGTITLDLPREFIDAEKQDGKDERFIILIDGKEVAHQESIIDKDSRIITINFEEGDSNIQIIGTFVVPEFGTTVMVILLAGITVIILTTKARISQRNIFL